MGKPFLLSFFRFAGCPFCNLRIHELVSRFDELANDFTIVAVFDSPLDNLIKHTKGHHAPSPILADEGNQYYHEYSIKKSIVGMLNGMFLHMPSLIKGVLKGYKPSSIKGNITTMPADFLVDLSGIIQIAHYGTHPGDHLDFNTVKTFSLA